MTHPTAYPTTTQRQFSTTLIRVSWRYALSYTLIVGFLAYFAVLALRQPTGSYDAWAFWNSRAQAMYYTDYMTAYTQYPAIPHPEYPPLLSVTVAFGWRVTGSISPVIPMVLQGVALVLLLWLFRRQWWAVCLVGVAAVEYAPMQYADVPLSVAFLVATIGLCRRDERLLGVGLGVGLLLKNEGALLTICALVTWIALLRRMPLRAIAIVAPFALLLVAHKLIVNVPNDVVGSSGIVERLLDISRYQLVIPYVFNGFANFAGGVVWFLLIAAIVYRARLRGFTPALAILLAWAGFIAIYLITPHDLEWHLRTSYDRLLMQLFPALVYVVSESRQSDSTIST